MAKKKSSTQDAEAKPVATLHVLETGPRNPVCECGHEEKTHYGSKDRWCNVSGCTCESWSRA